MAAERKRRHHHRSRNGCITCKQRHKRCDEGKPLCRNCLENGGSCGYLSGESSNVNTSSTDSTLIIAPHFHVPACLGPEVVDPFNTLPIPLSHDSNLLLNHFLNYRMFVRCLVRRSPGDPMFHLAISDAVFLHASLVLAGSHWVVLGGPRACVASSFYHHKVAALRIINERLDNPEEALLDSTIGAVACLTILETTVGSSEIGALHMNGLERLVGMRGGLHSSDLPHLLQRIVQLADLSTASAAQTSPRFGEPKVPAHPPSHAHTQQPLSDRHSRSQQSLADSEFFESTYDLDSKVAKLLADLKHISCQMAVMDNAASPTDNAVFSEEMREVEEYIDSCMRFGQFSDSIIKGARCRKSGPIVLGSYMYFYMNFRTIHVSSSLLDSVVTWLRRDLECSLMNDPDFLKPELLFWILFVGGCASEGRPERNWFREQLELFRGKLGLWSREEAKEMLKRFAWVERWNAEQYKMLWDELVSRRATKSLAIQGRSLIDSRTEGLGT